MHAFWFRIPLLLTLATLALAGDVGDRLAWPPSLDVAASANLPDGQDVVRAAAVPEQASLRTTARRLQISTGSRVLGDGPGGDPVRHPAPAPARALTPSGSLAAGRDLTPSRSHLGYAHDGMMVRTGARSSFGTSLPPPLLA